MAKVIWSPSALEDIKLIHEYLARDSINQANLFIDKIIASTEKLSQFPLSGRMIPEISQEYAREIIFGSYRIMYRIKNKNEIWITGIIHGARDWKPNKE